MKTIIQVWTHKVCNLTTTDDYAFWGIGDMIRGTIKLYQLCKRLNYKFISSYDEMWCFILNN